MGTEKELVNKNEELEFYKQIHIKFLDMLHEGKQEAQIGFNSNAKKEVITTILNVIEDYYLKAVASAKEGVFKNE